MSTNFKVALISIFVVGFIFFASVLYALQLVSVDAVKNQMITYQQALQSQIHALNNRLTNMERNVISGTVMQLPSSTTTPAATTSKK